MEYGSRAEPEKGEYSRLLGSKTLGFFSSVVIVTNNILGPGVLVLPSVYQEAGWVVPTVVLLLICVGSGFAATFLVDTMARVPENGRFQRRIEFVNIFEEFWGVKGMYIAQVGFIMNMMAQIISSIVSIAQVMDGFIVFLSPYSSTYALQLWPTLDFLTWKPPEKMLQMASHNVMSMQESKHCHRANVVPFRLEDGVVEGRVLISFGYVALAVMLIPMSLMNLDENIIIQKVSFYLAMILSLEFLFQFYMQGLGTHSIPAFGSNYGHVMGSTVFNYAFIAVIPSWVNEKRPDVSVNSTVWLSTAASTVLYALIGIMGASAYEHAHGNFLNTLSNVCSPTPTRISAFLFAFGMIGLGVPFAAIVTRYNLLVGRMCGPRMSTFWAIYFPWLISWVFYTGGLFNELIAWSGDIAIGPINFVLPILVTLTALGVRGVVPDSWGGWAAGAPTALPEWDSSGGGGGGARDERINASSLQVAREGDHTDPVNRETVVEPLPESWKIYYRPMATVTALILTVMMVLSLASHSRHVFDDSSALVKDEILDPRSDYVSYSRKVIHSRGTPRLGLTD